MHHNLWTQIFSFCFANLLFRGPLMTIKFIFIYLHYLFINVFPDSLHFTFVMLKLL